MHEESAPRVLWRTPVVVSVFAAGIAVGIGGAALFLDGARPRTIDRERGEARSTSEGQRGPHVSPLAPAEAAAALHGEAQRASGRTSTPPRPERSRRRSTIPRPAAD